MNEFLLKSNTPMWFSGICDDLHLKIAIWNQAYWYGEVHSTRQFLDPKDGVVIDKPTKCAHKIPFRLQEIDHLLRIIESIRPNSPLLEELKEIRSIWKYGQPVKGYVYNSSYWSKFKLPSGMHRVVTLAFYPEHVKEILDVLTEAKTGQKIASVDSSIAAKREEGKDLLEE